MACIGIFLVDFGLVRRPSYQLNREYCEKAVLPFPPLTFDMGEAQQRHPLCLRHDVDQ